MPQLTAYSAAREAGGRRPVLLENHNPRFIKILVEGLLDHRGETVVTSVDSQLLVLRSRRDPRKSIWSTDEEFIYEVQRDGGDQAFVNLLTILAGRHLMLEASDQLTVSSSAALHGLAQSIAKGEPI